MKGKLRFLWGVAVLGLVVLTATPAMAERFDVVFYELTEAATFGTDPTTGNFTRTGASSLAGEARIGKSPLCPRALVDFLVAADLVTAGRPCYVTAVGSDTIHLFDARGNFLGTGTFRADIQVKVQTDNPVDAPELVVLTAVIEDDLMLTDPALPLIAITGGSLRVTWRLDSGPLISAPLTGMIRLPFVVERDGRSRKPRRHEHAFYLSDSGRLIPVQQDEFSLGLATARFELNFEGIFP